MQNILAVSFGDTHCGSTTAVFPDRTLQFKYDDKNIIPYSPTPEQVAIYNHMMKCAESISHYKNGKKIIVVNGDVIDGNHHGSAQVVSAHTKHHVQVFIEVMDDFLARSGFSRNNGDELHFVSGTESHTGWEEYGIAEHYDFIDAQYHDEMEKELNGRLAWWVHQGAKPGKGTKEENPLRNWAYDQYWDCIKEKRRPPDMIFSSHFHKAGYAVYNDGYKHTIHYQTLASWQRKTRFGLRAAPFQRNDIGLTLTEVTAGGHIRIIPPLLMEA